MSSNDNQLTTSGGADRPVDRPVQENAGWWKKHGSTALIVSAAIAVAGAVWFISDNIHQTALEVRKDIGDKLDKQTEAIHENTKGLAVLKERVVGLENEVAKDVERLEEKIDGLSGVTKTSY